MFIIFRIFIASDQALWGMGKEENNSPSLPRVAGFVESLLSRLKYSLTDFYFFKITERFLAHVRRLDERFLRL